MSITYSKNKPRFSIVIPAYNEENYIAKTLESLKKQSYKGFVEIIVVDNNSTDSTTKVAFKHGATVVREPNIGVCWARQCGTGRAKGEIIISTDADTTYDKDWITNIDNIFKANKSIVAVAGTCQFKNAPFWANLFTNSLFGLTNFIYKITGLTIYASGTNIAFKKSAWIKYDTRLTQGGDELDLIRNLKQKGKIYFDKSNPTFTSPRRVSRGLLYNTFVTFIIFYLIEYNLSRAFNRPILGPCPNFRNNTSRKQYSINKLLINLTDGLFRNKPPIE